ncbi:MAG: hypothetical protein JNK15_16840 [Planctomycetes bacterium]|nr:hypothetical protein [Planctomycetota bacterium]
MTADPPLHPAAERLLDAAMHQHFAGTIAKHRPSMPTWLAAALLLLGLAVVTMVWVGVANYGDAVAQQPEPLPLPPEVDGKSPAAIAALPATTENLVARLVDPRDLQVVTRFARLRGLRLWPKPNFVGMGSLDSMWNNPPAELLQPLCQLPNLEVLGLPDELTITPALLAPLAGHPRLRELRLVRDRFTIDEGFVAALARIPKLESLHLSFVPLNPDAMRLLATVPLRSIAFEHCPGLDAGGWQGLVAMQHLRRISFREWDWNVVAGQIKTPPGWHPAADDLQQLQRLPHLHCLELRRCNVGDEQLAALPDRLTTLRLTGSKLTAEGIGALRRLLALRTLEFDAKSSSSVLASRFEPDRDDLADAFAAALAPLRLQSLDYRGALTADVAAAIGAQRHLRELAVASKVPAGPHTTAMFRRLGLRQLLWHAPLDAAVLTAIAAQPELVDLELRADTITDLEALSPAPKLERLTLTQMTIGNGIPADVLTPLARCASLREITVNVSITRGEPHPSEADLQRAVGDRIRVRLQESEFTVRK